MTARYDAAGLGSPGSRQLLVVWNSGDPRHDRSSVYAWAPDDPRRCQETRAHLAGLPQPDKIPGLRSRPHLRERRPEPLPTVHEQEAQGEDARPHRGWQNDTAKDFALSATS